MCSNCVELRIPCTNRSTRHFRDSQCMGSSCHEVEQSVRQKVGETDKLSQMHLGSSANLSCWRQPVRVNQVRSKTVILLEICHATALHIC